MVRLLVSGARACFRRPEFTDDLVTYDVITPAAARSILDNIWSACAGRWVVESVELIRPIKKSWSSIVTMAGATRRCHLLVDVAYVLTVRLRAETMNDRAEGRVQLETFRQRVAEGKFSRLPFLGLADFPASVSLLPDHAEAQSEQPKIVDISSELGWMLYDTHGTGRTKARFFEASMVAGRIAVGALDADQLAS